MLRVRDAWNSTSVTLTRGVGVCCDVDDLVTDVVAEDVVVLPSACPGGHDASAERMAAAEAMIMGCVSCAPC